MFYRKGAVALGIVAALSLAACAPAGDSGAGKSEGESYTIKFGNVISAGDTQNQAYDYFAELVSERSDGRITVEVYPDSQLGGEREMIEAVQAGNLEMTAPSVGVLANFDDSLQVFDFPFIFEDAETAYKVLDSEIGDSMLEGIEESGLTALGWGENGFRNLAMTKETITAPEQIKGKKLRTMQVPMHIAFWESLGASPTPMAFPEVFTALQQGVVDGVENPYELLYSAKFTEPAAKLTELRWIYDPEVILIGSSFLEGLPEADQEIITTAADDMIVKLRELKAGINSEVRGKIEADGGTVADLDEAERQAWIDAAVPFYASNAANVDTEKLKAILEAAGNTTFLDAIK
ncbi:TRAP transporter substrate-binding protein [Leucobacter sp. NPDC015123]|uniref:TRAP transporter substrate-binding protein n=1 Tax=Leucobacter sp. NPDC015123 TaxID=3364129 RepID=UPI0036F469F8